MGLEFLSIFILKEKYKNVNNKNNYKKKITTNSPKQLPKNESYDNLIKYHSLLL